MLVDPMSIIYALDDTTWWSWNEDGYDTILVNKQTQL